MITIFDSKFIKPSIIGLDSSTALSLLSIIRSVSISLQIPVVQSIHQPSTEMFYSFGKILLLSEGKMIYFGTPSNLMGYLLNLGYVPIAIYVNPADFVLGLLDPFSIQSSKDILVEQWSNENVIVESEDTFVPNNIESQRTDTDDTEVTLEMEETYVFKEPGIDIADYSNGLLKDRDVQNSSIVINSFHPEHSIEYPSSYGTQYFALLIRASKTAQSSRLGILNTAETIVLALIIGACWFQRPSDEAHFDDVTSFLFLSIVYWFFVALYSGLLEFLPERECLRKERESGMYRVSAYFLAKTLSSIPLRIALPTLYVFIAYPMAVKAASLSTVLGREHVNTYRTKLYPLYELNHYL
jgi:hypothetical protein